MLDQSGCVLTAIAGSTKPSGWLGMTPSDAAYLASATVSGTYPNSGRWLARSFLCLPPSADTRYKVKKPAVIAPSDELRRTVRLLSLPTGLGSAHVTLRGFSSSTSGPGQELH